MTEKSVLRQQRKESLCGSALTAETATRILEIMREQPTITVKKIADQMRLSVAGVRCHINKMKKDGLVEHVGPSKKGTWLLHDES